MTPKQGVGKGPLGHCISSKVPCRIVGTAWADTARGLHPDAPVDAPDHGLRAVGLDCQGSTKLVADATDGAWQWDPAGTTDPFANPGQ